MFSVYGTAPKYSTSPKVDLEPKKNYIQYAIKKTTPDPFAASVLFIECTETGFLAKKPSLTTILIKFIDNVIEE
ncbi:hypothetical protein BB561_006725, partial [Smittium simulii]